MLRIAVCDDMPAHIAGLSEMIRRVMAEKLIVIDTYGSAAALIESERGNQRHDIIFLDIQLRGEDGIVCAKTINRISPDAQIIFVTSYLTYAIDVYDAIHAYFLVKPVRQEKLRCALSSAMERVSALRASRFLLPLRGGERRMFSLSEILYFERIGRITSIVTPNGSYETPLSLTELSELLPPGQFARPHNSFLVNLSRVKRTSRLSACMDNGMEVPVSHQKRDGFFEALSQSI